MLSTQPKTLNEVHIISGKPKPPNEVNGQWSTKTTRTNDESA
jgi:hypothetical protein